MIVLVIRGDAACQDYDTLMQFFSEAGGDSWYDNNGWADKMDHDCCNAHWVGVSCDADNFVTQLSLSSNNLSSTSFPLAVTELTKLNYLTMSGNMLQGQLPDMSGLTALTWIVLNDNLLDGPVSRLPPNLLTLGLIGNGLSSQLPEVNSGMLCA